jgi:hypothetical protein
MHLLGPELMATCDHGERCDLLQHVNVTINREGEPLYADRRKAFENRIGELLNDHRRAYPASARITNNQWRDLGGRILSALEDAYQMGRHNPSVPRGTSEDEPNG